MPEPNSTALTLVAHEGEPRVRDTDLAARLGFAKPAKIRELIARHGGALTLLGLLPTVGTTHAANGRTFDAFFLNKKQAIFITAKSETPTATEITIEIIEKFDAYERGLISAAPATPLPPANPYSPEKIAAVREARLTFGRAAAQKVWHTAGLPPVSPLPEEPRQASMFDAPAAPAKSQGRYAPGRPQGEEFRTLMAMRPGDEVVLPSRPPHTRFSATLTRARKQSPFLLSSRREGDAIRVSCSAPTRQH